MTEEIGGRLKKDCHTRGASKGYDREIRRIL